MRLRDAKTPPQKKSEEKLTEPEIESLACAANDDLTLRSLEQTSSSNEKITLDEKKTTSTSLMEGSNHNIIQVNNDPTTFQQLSSKEIELVVLTGPSSNPNDFPRDSHGRVFPTSVFTKEQQNGERTARDWLVWRLAAKGLFCFLCCIFRKEIYQCGKLPSIANPSSTGLSDNWRKLYERLKSHERSMGVNGRSCLLYTSPSPRDLSTSRMPSSA